MSALEMDSDAFRALGLGNRRFRLCANAQHIVCNWLIAADSPEVYCAACSHNAVIPALDTEERRLAWRKLEFAKHRLFYTLFRLTLSQTQNMRFAAEPLVFKFLDDAPNTPLQVMTGHDDGVITIALKEADDAEREQRRKAMGEPYRTLLGHFRHEVGHYIWDSVVRDGPLLDKCRAVFGDDRGKYDAALKRHYQNGPPPDWQSHFVSTYATCHPWEDFAETWAHYLHIVDAVELACAFNMDLSPSVNQAGAFRIDHSVDPYRAVSIQTLGKDDLYPFVLEPPVVEKLDFIHGLVHSTVGFEIR